MLRRFLKPYIKESILAPFFKMLEAIFELFVPLVVADIIDVGIAHGDKIYIVKMVGLMCLLAFVGLICSVTAQYFAAKAASKTAGAMRSALFKHIGKLSYSQLDKAGTETLITRMTSDINQVQSGINMALRLFLRSPFIVFGAMIMALRINLKAGLVFVGVIVVLSVVVFGVMGITRPMYKNAQSKLDKILGITRENLTGARVIRAFNCQEEEVNSFYEENGRLVSLQKLAGKISGLSNPLTVVIVNLAIIMVIYVGAGKVNSGILQQGEVVALYNYMTQILVELVKFANLIVTITKAVACMGRVRDVFEIPEEDDNGTAEKGTSDIAVEFDDVSFSYETGSDEALSHINFKAKKGESIGIIGGTGSGKSTLINLIMGFYDCTEGKILVEGEKISRYKNSALREKMSVVPQKAQLFKGTIRENLSIGVNKPSEEDIETALEISQAKEFVDKKEGRLEYQLEQGGKNLSGGQRQRLTIARALANKPEILALDDSGSALDYATDAKLRKAIRTMKDKPTVFISSQRASSVMSCDKIIVLEDGEIVGLDSHENLMKNCEVYREIYYCQFRKEEA